MRLVSVSTIVCLATLACSSSSDTTSQQDATSAGTPEAMPAAQPATETPAKTDSKPATPPDAAIAEKRAKARTKITSTDAAELASRRKQMLAALNQGRKLVKAGDLEYGIREYQALLAIAPNYGPALGELGWAELELEQYDDANAHTLRALDQTTDANKRGMLLYNLGRIAEARGQTDAAIQHYRDSLAARPNDIVSGRLATLQAGGPTPAASSPIPAGSSYAGLSVLGAGLADLAAMCELASRESLCGADDCELIESPEGDPSLGVLYSEDPGSMRCWNPAMKTAAGWVLFESAAIGQYGSEVDQDVDSISTRIETNDAGKFLLIEYSDHLYERNWDSADLEDEEAELPAWTTTDSENVVICRLDGEPACTQAITVRLELSGDEGSVGPSGPKGSSSASYSASLSLRGDVIVIADVATKGKIELGKDGGEWHGDLMLPAGEYRLDELAKPRP